MASNRYCIETAKRGTAGCKECKVKIDKGLARIAKILPNPFGEGEMKEWYHVSCIFKKLSRAKATTKKIDNEDDLEGWDDMDDETKEEVLKQIKDFWDVNKAVAPKSTKKPKQSPKSLSPGKKSPERSQASPRTRSPSPSGSKKEPTEDDSFRVFRKVCASIAEVPEYKEKTAVVSKFFKNGSKKNGFQSDLYLWVKLLLPGVDKRVYNLQNKQLVKLFSQIFDADLEEMVDDLNKGDVAETIGDFFENSSACPPAKKSNLTLQEVDKFLDKLTTLSKEEEQMNFLKSVAKRCTANDLRMFVRLIKHDLCLHAGPKHILEALHPSAYQAFQTSHNLKEVVKKATQKGASGSLSEPLSVKASILTPVRPMLAEACGTIEKAFKRCPNGLMVEIKYDGERVQVHKKGNEFSYFSRSLKPVVPAKVMHLKDYIPKAFPHGNDLILDSEILLVDSDGKPLPFGTLGEHKKKAFKDATVCLFVFDCLQYNDKNLMNEPLHYRRKVLKENMKEVKNHVVLSEMKPVDSPKELIDIIKSVISQGLEGLVIKDKNSIYEPGKRRWIKMKKDYLTKGDVAGAMPDSADLVVLGAYYGTGRKGGIMSVFLMCCFNERTKKWCTVTKVGGRTDADLKKLQSSLKMREINKDPSKVPSWLDVTKTLVPDFVAINPEESEVWEITGAEFTKSEVHTADGISIRFPRVARVRKDKTYKEATTLKELRDLYKVSKQTTEMIGLSVAGGSKCSSDASDSPSPTKKGRSRSPDETSTPSKSPAKKSRSRSNSPDPKKSPAKRKSRSRSKSPARKKSKSSSSPATKKASPSRSRAKKLETSSNHSGENISASARNSIETSDNDLPNVFTGVKLYISKSVDQIDTLRKYFIAFDGTNLKEHEKMDASHIVTSSMEDDCPPEATRVFPDWLWDCIKMKKLLPTKAYQLCNES